MFPPFGHGKLVCVSMGHGSPSAGLLPFNSCFLLQAKACNRNGSVLPTNTDHIPHAIAAPNPTVGPDRVEGHVLIPLELILQVRATDMVCRGSGYPCVNTSAVPPHRGLNVLNRQRTFCVLSGWDKEWDWIAACGRANQSHGALLHDRHGCQAQKLPRRRLADTKGVPGRATWQYTSANKPLLCRVSVHRRDSFPLPLKPLRSSCFGKDLAARLPVTSAPHPLPSFRATKCSLKACGTSGIWVSTTRRACMLTVTTTTMIGARMRSRVRLNLGVFWTRNHPQIGTAENGSCDSGHFPLHSMLDGGSRGERNAVTQFRVSFRVSGLPFPAAGWATKCQGRDPF